MMRMFVRPALAAIALMLASGAPAWAKPVFDNDFESLPATWAAGGTNYLWFGDDGQCTQGSRDAFGLVKRYHETDSVRGPVRGIARRQLASMHKRGMRHLSLGIFFIHGPTPSGTLVDSSDPAQVAQAVANIEALVQDVKNAGYHQVLFRFFPTGNINPSQPQFPHRDSAEYWPRVDEYWNLVQAIRPVLAASGISYRIDLMVEGAPRDSNNVALPESERYKYPANLGWSRAVRALWQRYVAAYGHQDTIGFSFLVDEDNNRLRSRVRHMRYVYEGVYPHLFAMDFYAGDALDEYEKFVRMHTHMNGQNPPGASWHQSGWIIAEAYYEDPYSARALARAIHETGRDVFYLTQWPLDRAGACQQPHVNVAPPYEWRVWPAYGF